VTGRHRPILDAERAVKGHAAAREPAIGRLVSGIFEFRTLAEAEKLSTLLAANYPDPDRVAVGIWELLSNAVEHGNLAIDFAEKSRLLRSGTYHAEIERRLARPPFGERVARVEFRRSRTRIRLSIVDEGQGFDFRAYLDADMPLDAPNGRGIAIASRLSFDRLTYRGAGNRVDAISVLPRTPSA